MPIIHIFLFQDNKGSQVTWKYFIYFCVMLRTGTFKVVLQMTTCLSNFKGPAMLLFYICVNKKSLVEESETKNEAMQIYVFRSVGWGET